jgi:RNA ligase
MTNFPYLKFIQPVLEDIRSNPEIQICKHEGTPFASICYAVAEKDTFATALRRECRGLMYNTETGEIVLRPFHKFFNVGENEDSLLLNLKVKQGPGEMFVPEKIDGMMVAMSVYDDKLIAATKRTLLQAPFYLQAERVVRAMQHRCGPCTVLFERVYSKLAKNQQSVLTYDADELVVLAVRLNRTGEYIDRRFYQHVLDAHGINEDSKGIRLVRQVHFPSFERLIDAHYTQTDVEGWVIEIKGQFYKLKTEWYINRHHLVGTLCERSIAKMVLNERIDDDLSYISIRFADTHVYKDVLAIIERVQTHYGAYMARIVKLTRDHDGEEMRDLVKVLDKGDIFYLNQQRKLEANPKIQFSWVEQYWKEHKADYGCELLYDITHPL